MDTVGLGDKTNEREFSDAKPTKVNGDSNVPPSYAVIEESTPVQVSSSSLQDLTEQLGATKLNTIVTEEAPGAEGVPASKVSENTNEAGKIQRAERTNQNALFGGRRGYGPRNPTYRTKDGQKREVFIQQNFKTEICRSHRTLGFCEYEDNCQFAHGIEELRPRHYGLKYKTQDCKNYHNEGHCRFGSRCKFIHDEHRIQVADDEFWLISPSENLVRVEVVENAIRQAELKKLVDPRMQELAILNNQTRFSSQTDTFSQSPGFKATPKQSSSHVSERKDLMYQQQTPSQLPQPQQSYAPTQQNRQHQLPGKEEKTRKLKKAGTDVSTSGYNPYVYGNPLQPTYYGPVVDELGGQAQGAYFPYVPYQANNTVLYGPGMPPTFGHHGQPMYQPYHHPVGNVYQGPPFQPHHSNQQSSQ